MYSRAKTKENDAFIDEDYEEAVENYSKAIRENAEDGRFHSKRSNAYLKLKKYKEAVDDATRAIELNENDVKAYLRKGTALYHQKHFALAKEVLQQGQEKDSSDKYIQNWIEKCCKELKKLPKEEPKPIKETVDNIPMPTGPKTRYEWYQTERDVIVTILLKGVSEADFQCNMQPTSLSVTVRMATGSDYSLELDLAHPVVPDNSSHRILGSKIEIKLRKGEGHRWVTLEGDGASPSLKPVGGATGTLDSTKYPTSSHNRKDWDKIVTEIKKEESEEKKDGDQGVNELFQKIYADGSDEVKKAMNKSFSESGGTVLSTNWKDIGKEKTEVKPPDGMEYKQYEY